MAFDAENINWRETPESSNVLRVGWDRHMHMYAQFKGGAIYLYENVTRQRVVACSRAASVGSYFHQFIKPNYNAIKVG